MTYSQVPEASGVESEFSRDELMEAVLDDYTTEIVPDEKRRPLWHLVAIMVTLYLDFGYVFMGFSLHDAGYSLWGTIGITAFGTALYVVYAIFGGYLGAKAGQTHSVLSRSIFGSVGSGLVSFLLFFIFIGWAGFEANLLAQMLGGLMGWGAILLLSVVFGFFMVTNNTLGFTGISAWARYVVSPLMIAWILYLVIKGFVDLHLSGHPSDTVPLGGFGAAVTLVIGFATWGQEPDFFRFARPKLAWPVAAYVVAFAVFMLSSIGGWMMATISKTSSFGPALKTITSFSLFGVTGLAFFLVVVAQVGVNDGNYYVIINGGQNVLAAIRGWKRIYTCLLAAMGGALMAWLVPYVITNGFYEVGAVAAIAIPSATIIMVVDHFLVPKLFNITRPLNNIPRWSEAGRVNLPALVALLAAIGFGGWATGSFPGLTSADTIGPVPVLEAWLIAIVVYLAGVAITRAMASSRAGMYRLLGFSQPALAAVGEAMPPEEGVEPTAVGSADPLRSHGT